LGAAFVIALSRDEKTETEEDDPYADYEILDDLMW